MAMTMTGEVTLPADRPKVWALLNDPEVLKACIPGCESLERTGDNGFAAVVKTKIGPVSATFKGKVELSDIVAARRLHHQGRGRGRHRRLRQGRRESVARRRAGGTLLHYDVEAHVGGKIAQLGARLIDGVAKNMADKFFANFAAIAAAGARRLRAEPAAVNPAAAPAANRRPPRRRDARASRRRKQSQRKRLGSGGYRNGSCLYGGERPARVGRCRSANAAGAVPARESAPDRHACRLRHLAMRRLRRPCRRPRDQVLHRAGGELRRRAGDDDRGPRQRTASCTRCSRPSRTIMACNAASARRA